MTPAAPAAEVFDRPDFSDAEVRGLEAVAAGAWPAQVREPLDGWLLRHSAAPTRRVNSTFPNACGGGLELAERIGRAETFYRDRGQPPRFQLTRASLPAGLDAELAARGYVVEAPVDIQVAAAGAIGPGPAPAGEVVVRETLTPAWMEVYAEGFGRDVTAVIDELGYRAAFAAFERDGETLAVGLGVGGDGWLGVFGMLTLEAERGRGIGRALLAALAADARAAGAWGLYLQVEKDNPRARALYERCGFRTVYDYHYRTLF
ncbi:MAG: GNAT family N-acetyltransferase [Magnetovibrio sp.]|nr:GNAT family N-acetyltransferase [Magnetovibrio sp.]